MTDLVNGPDASWMQDAHAGQGRLRPIGDPQGDAETRRASLIAAFELDPALASYREPGLLGVYLRNRWLQEQLQPTFQSYDTAMPAPDLLDHYLEEAVDHAGPDLATAAARALAALPESSDRHAGNMEFGNTDPRNRQRVVIGPIHWPNADRNGLYGMGQVEWQGEVWGTREVVYTSGAFRDFRPSASVPKYTTCE